MIDYQQCQQDLMAIFAQGDFRGKFDRGELVSGDALLQELPNGTRISARFPGYKTKVVGSAVTYDYRVDIEVAGHAPTPLSHCNIIVDLYHKAATGSVAATRLASLLSMMYRTRNDADTQEDVATHIRAVAPPESLLEEVRAAHRELNKNFNADGNLIDYTLLELLHAIKWIVLQEDINYPMSRGKEGRRMPLARYLEAVHVTQATGHTLSEVIARALSHSRPRPWPGVTYGTV